MKKIYTSVHSRQFVAISALCIFATMLAAQPAIQWQKTFGGSNYDEAHAIRQTSDGGYIVSGRTDSNDGDVGSGNHGSADGWILKLTAQGDIEWKKILGGTKGDSFGDIQQTPDGGYIVGGATTSDDGDISGLIGVQDIWILKLNGTGDIQWQKTLGGSAIDNGSGAVETSDGGYMVCASTASNDEDVETIHGEFDAWLLKLNENGQLQWQKPLGGSRSDYANTIQRTNDNGHVLAGNTRSDDGDVTINQGQSDFWIIKMGAESVGLEEILPSTSDARLGIFPNPANQTISLSIPEQMPAMTARVFDFLGRQISQQILPNGSSLDISLLPNGLYSIVATTPSGNVFSNKFRKQD